LRGKLGALASGPAALLQCTRSSSNGINGLYGHGFYGNGYGNGYGYAYGNGYGVLEIRHAGLDKRNTALVIHEMAYTA